MQAARRVWEKLSAEAALALLLGPPFGAAGPLPASDLSAARSDHRGAPGVAGGVNAVGVEAEEEETRASDVAGVVLGEARGEVKEVVVLTVVFSEAHMLEWQVASFRCPFSASLSAAPSASLAVSLAVYLSLSCWVSVAAFPCPYVCMCICGCTRLTFSGCWAAGGEVRCAIFAACSRVYACCSCVLAPASVAGHGLTGQDARHC